MNATVVGSPPAQSGRGYLWRVLFGCAVMFLVLQGGLTLLTPRLVLQIGMPLVVLAFANNLLKVAAPDARPQARFDRALADEGVNR